LKRLQMSMWKDPTIISYLTPIIMTLDLLKKKKKKEANNMNMPPISEELQTFIDHFKDLETFDDIATAAEDYCQFNINDSHTLHSDKQIIVDLLMAYKLKKIEKLSEDGCEKDVIHRLWRNLDLFYEDDYSVSRGDYMCLATSLRLNGDCQNEHMKRRHAVKPDIILQKDKLEYAAGENKFTAGAPWTAPKVIYDNSLKLSKTMKDILVRLRRQVDNDPALVKKFTVFGIICSNLDIQFLFMDIHGYTCRIKRSKKIEIPVDIKKISTNITPR
jgi:hypothetical protein